LGKISRSQILKAFEVLNELMNELDKKKKAPNYDRLIVDFSNRFFTLIPHNFGVRSIPVLTDKKMVHVRRTNI